MINGDSCQCLPVLTSPSAYQPPFIVSRILQLLVFPGLFHHRPFYPRVWSLAVWGYLGVLPFCHLPLSFLRFHCNHFCYFFAISCTSLFYFWPLLFSFMNFSNKRRSWFVKCRTEIHTEIQAEKVYRSIFIYSWILWKGSQGRDVINIEMSSHLLPLFLWLKARFYRINYS